jgi:hypothetical protein
LFAVLLKLLGLPLTFLTIDADSRPRYGVEPGSGYLFLTVHADPVDSLVQPDYRFFNRSKKFGIGLLQGEADMDVTFHAGVVDPVSTFGARFHGRNPGRRRAQDIIALGRENFSIF